MRNAIALRRGWPQVHFVCDYHPMDLLSSELSPATLAALQSHLREREENEADEHQENFNMSQFWYDDETAEKFAREALEHSNGGPIAFLAAPTAFKALKKIAPERKDVYNFEFDRRFGETHPTEFVFYDYNEPLNVPEHLHHTFDFVMIDPPYLNPDCFGAFAETMTLLSRKTNSLKGLDVSEAAAADVTKNLINTGRVVRDAIFTTVGHRPTQSVPKHALKMSNPFHIYTNYVSERFGTWLGEDE